VSGRLLVMHTYLCYSLGCNCHTAGECRLRLGNFESAKQYRRTFDFISCSAEPHTLFRPACYCSKPETNFGHANSFDRSDSMFRRCFHTSAVSPNFTKNYREKITHVDISIYKLLNTAALCACPGV